MSDEKKAHGFDVEVVQSTTVSLGSPKKESDGKHELHLYKDGQKWQQARTRRLDLKRKELEKEEMEEVKTKPWVTEMAHDLARDNFEQFITNQEKWTRNVDAKKTREKMKCDAERQEREEPHDASWDMSRGSKEIIQRKSAYNSPSSKRGWRNNLAKYLRAKERPASETPAFTPKINQTSRKMVRRGSVGPRLHSLHAEQQENVSFRRECVSPQRRGSQASRTSSVGQPAKREATREFEPYTTPRAEDFAGPKSGSAFEVHDARLRVQELAEALEFEIERNQSYDRLSREVQKEAEYLTQSLRKERERNDLLVLELQHEKARSASLDQALAHHLSQANVSRNIGGPLVRPSDVLRQHLEGGAGGAGEVSLTLSPRRCHPTANDTGLLTPRSLLGGVRTPHSTQSPLEINLDDL